MDVQSALHVQSISHNHNMVAKATLMSLVWIENYLEEGIHYTIFMWGRDGAGG